MAASNDSPNRYSAPRCDCSTALNLLGYVVDDPSQICSHHAHAMGKESPSQTHQQDRRRSRLRTLSPDSEISPSEKTLQKPRFHCTRNGCRKSYSRRSKLRDHISSFHQGVKPHHCSRVGCDKIFANQTDCNRHEKTHSRRKEFRCPSCGSQFSRKDSLGDHQRRFCRAQKDIRRKETTSRSVAKKDGGILIHYDKANPDPEKAFIVRADHPFGNSIKQFMLMPDMEVISHQDPASRVTKAYPASTPTSQLTRTQIEQWGPEPSDDHPEAMPIQITEKVQHSIPHLPLKDALPDDNGAAKSTQNIMKFSTLRDRPISRQSGHSNEALKEDSVPSNQQSSIGSGESSSYNLWQAVLMTVADLKKNLDEDDGNDDKQMEEAGASVERPNTARSKTFSTIRWQAWDEFTASLHPFLEGTEQNPQTKRLQSNNRTSGETPVFQSAQSVASDRTLPASQEVSSFPKPITPSTGLFPAASESTSRQKEPSRGRPVVPSRSDIPLFQDFDAKVSSQQGPVERRVKEDSGDVYWVPRGEYLNLSKLLAFDPGKDRLDWSKNTRIYDWM